MYRFTPRLRILLIMTFGGTAYMGHYRSRRDNPCMKQVPVLLTVGLRSAHMVFEHGLYRFTIVLLFL